MRVSATILVSMISLFILAVPSWGGQDIGGRSVAGSLYLSEQTTTRSVRSLHVDWDLIPLSPSAHDSDSLTSGDIRQPVGTVTLPFSSQKTDRPYALRKRFDLPEEFRNKRVLLYVEGVGKGGTVRLNGTAILPGSKNSRPFVANISDHLFSDRENELLMEIDPTASGISPSIGDCYLIATGPVYITDPHGNRDVSDGGVFFRTETLNMKEKTAKVGIRVQMANETDTSQKVKLQILMTDPKGINPIGDSVPVHILPHSRADLEVKLDLNEVTPWSPEKPDLYRLDAELWSTDQSGASAEMLDNLSFRVGVRTLSFTDREIIINGRSEQIPNQIDSVQPAYLPDGIAEPNNLQWQKAFRLAKNGVRLVRCDSELADPAFLDACDKAGIWVIESISATPGETSEEREERLRAMIRRDRNRPSLLSWEIKPSNTDHEDASILRLQQIVEEEYPHEPFHTPAQENDSRRLCSFPQETLPDPIHHPDSDTAPDKLGLELDIDKKDEIYADGSSIVPLLVRHHQDDDGTVSINIEGDAHFVDGSRTYSVPLNNKHTRLLIRTGTQAGKIRIQARTHPKDSQKTEEARLEFDTGPFGMKILPSHRPVTDPTEQQGVQE